MTRSKGAPSQFPGTGQTAWSEPLFQEADPHITKLAIEARMKEKDGPKKNKKKNIQAFRTLPFPAITKLLVSFVLYLFSMIFGILTIGQNPMTRKRADHKKLSSPLIIK